MNLIKRWTAVANDIVYLGCSLTDRNIKQYVSKDEIDTSQWFATVLPYSRVWNYTVQKMSDTQLKVYDSGSHRSRSEALSMARSALLAARAKDEFDSQPWVYLQ